MTCVRFSIPNAPYRLTVYAACSAFALIVNFALGKDMPPDMLSYHLYAGFNAVHDRFNQDYFPAGPQSYFNPFVYAPFYGLVESGLSSLEISSILAFVHSILLWLTYELAVAVCPSDDRRQRLIFGLCGIAFAAVNPIVLQQIGSSFSDIVTGELILAGWLLLALATRAPLPDLVVGAGLLCGVAAGLKLTNAVHAVAGFTLLAMLPQSVGQRLRSGIAYGLSLGVGLLAAAAPWCYRLEMRFGNPLFPLMNDLFRSPEFTTAPVRALRFVPATLQEALWRPFAMINPVTMVHEEPRAPDLRYAALSLLAMAVICRWLWRLRAVPTHLHGVRSEVDADRTLTALAFGLAVDWAAWLAGSGNSRYFLPMSSVAAVVLVALIFRLFAAHLKIRVYVLGALLSAQCVQLSMGTDFRWNQAPWDPHWINIEMPRELASKPNLFLTMGAQTNSFVAPYLASGSSLVNFSGLYTLGADGANGVRIKSLIRSFAPNIRMLIRGEKIYPDGVSRAPHRRQIDDALEPFGLRVDQSDCATIAIRGLPPEYLDFTTSNSLPTVAQPRDTSYLVSCRVVADLSDHSAEAPLKLAVDLALNHLEDACPALFQPGRPATEYGAGGGLRRYGATDLVAWVHFGSVHFFQPTLGGDVIDLGKEGEWAKAPLSLRCGRKDGRYYASRATGSEDADTL